ncbi:MAG: hypothetical protein ABI559_11185 [Chloroflexota bacterium]
MWRWVLGVIAGLFFAIAIVGYASFYSLSAPSDATATPVASASATLAN